mmetsp:Transcript_22758/g.71263  ORF Transcript_22758/g.71263 Transcript_22758/m.71263 type:complete len:208 (-) Transcript_22758:353-976(-)
MPYSPACLDATWSGPDGRSGSIASATSAQSCAPASTVPLSASCSLPWPGSSSSSCTPSSPAPLGPGCCASATSSISSSVLVWGAGLSCSRGRETGTRCAGAAAPTSPRPPLPSAPATSAWPRALAATATAGADSSPPAPPPPSTSMAAGLSSTVDAWGRRCAAWAGDAALGSNPCPAPRPLVSTSMRISIPAPREALSPGREKASPT